MTQSKPRKNTPKPRTPAHRKRYDVNHIQGEDGEELVKSRLPRHWIKRKVSPDYGIDLHVEVFDKVEDTPGSAETRGEHFYVQVKSQIRTPVTQRTVRSRRNVAKHRPDPRTGKQYEIPVIECTLEVGELMTVEAMGPAVPVLLCVADIETETVYYVCLNDYISKVLLPNNPAYRDQQYVTIHVPAWNVLDSHDSSFTYVEQLARRGKLYSAFNTFVYQRIELGREQEHPVLVFDKAKQLAHLGEEMVAMLDVFLSETTRLDIWQPAGAGSWAPLDELGELYGSLRERLTAVASWCAESDVEEFVQDLDMAASKAVNIGRMYEELVREWRLPTILSAKIDDFGDSKYKANAKERVVPPTAHKTAQRAAAKNR